MINRKNHLNIPPDQPGIRDAVHVAIVSVRAACAIAPGERCGLNKFNEAVPSQAGPGICNPFLRENVIAGDHFWLVLDQDAVPNVQHVWEHPDVDFAPPTRPPALNGFLQTLALNIGVTYKQLFDACQHVATHNTPCPYPGTLNLSVVESTIESSGVWDMWSEWASEVGWRFPNRGTECCPEYEYPDVALFTSKVDVVEDE